MQVEVAQAQHQPLQMEEIILLVELAVVLVTVQQHLLVRIQQL